MHASIIKSQKSQHKVKQAQALGNELLIQVGSIDTALAFGACDWEFESRQF